VACKRRIEIHRRELQRLPRKSIRGQLYENQYTDSPVQDLLLPDYSCRCERGRK
jgi:hypothetical protein